MGTLQIVRSALGAVRVAAHVAGVPPWIHPRACPPCSPLCRLPPPWRARRGGCPPNCALEHAQLLLRPRPQARRCAPPQRHRVRLCLRPRRRSCPSPLLNVCCIAAHVPHGTHRRAHPRPGYVVGVPVLIVHRMRLVRTSTGVRIPYNFLHAVILAQMQQRVQLVHTFVHLYVVTKY
ncbi:hypothetical protein B0H14DRAFT_302128 [Mycena olivaceomarginata]|nr:hypothetical protein B0H14DRAFT_302128 [Mycena olivaceomarginata]